MFCLFFGGRRRGRASMMYPIAGAQPCPATPLGHKATTHHASPAASARGPEDPHIGDQGMMYVSGPGHRISDQDVCLRTRTLVFGSAGGSKYNILTHTSPPAPPPPRMRRRNAAARGTGTRVFCFGGAAVIISISCVYILLFGGGGNHLYHLLSYLDRCRGMPI